MVVLMTGFASGMIWSLLVGPLRDGLKGRAIRLAQTQDKVRAAQRSVSLSKSVAADLVASRNRLERLEAALPTGDVYRWAIRTFTRLQTNRVQVITVAPPRSSPSTILPQVPHETATFSVIGRAYYHEFGAFLANLENEFPHLRLRRLELEATHFGETDSDEQEKLNFKLEIATLVKSTTAKP